MVNIFRPEWVERDEPLFRGRTARMGAPAGAHQLINGTDEPVRPLVVSTMRYPDVAEMPDSDKVLVISHPPGTDGRLFGAFARSAQVERLHGETDE